MRVVACITARNEEARIADTIRSVWRQTHPPDHVFVVAGDCADGTERVAHCEGAWVFRSEGTRLENTSAIDQALQLILPALEDEDVVLVMDAGLVLDKEFTEHALHQLSGEVCAGVGTEECEIPGPAGIASLLKVSALREVSTPHPDGRVRGVDVPTEVYELTSRLRRLGHKVMRLEERAFSIGATEVE